MSFKQWLNEAMHQVWRYDTPTGQQHGIMASDFGGTDVSYKFHRIGKDGLPITHPNGGKTIDIVSGPALRNAKRVGAVNPGQPWQVNESVINVKQEIIAEGKYSKILNSISADDVGKGATPDSVRIRRQFFYSGVTPHTRKSPQVVADHAAKVSHDLDKAGIKHTVIDHGEVYKPFKAGASVKNQSHWWVDVKLHPNTTNEEHDPSFEERLDPKSPYYDAEFAELRRRAYAAFDADKKARPQRYKNYDKPLRKTRTQK